MQEVKCSQVDQALVAELFDGIRAWSLYEGVNGAKALFVEIDAGAKWDGIDSHESGSEEIYVISGTLEDETGKSYPSGSFIHYPKGSSHIPQSKTGCCLFIFNPGS